MDVRFQCCVDSVLTLTVIGGNKNNCQMHTVVWIVASHVTAQHIHTSITQV